MIELNSVFQNRYRIDRYIGKGGMADVYRATDLITRNNVAIKICRDDVMNKEEMFQRFLYEIKKSYSLCRPTWPNGKGVKQIPSEA